MADETLIAWTDHTWNPWMGCAKVSAGCANCYAERLTDERMNIQGLWGIDGERRKTGPATWAKPREWNESARRAQTRAFVFCASLCDVFEDHPVADSLRPLVFDTIRSTPWLDWQLLTKRPENIARNLPNDWRDGYPNVWLGTSVEDMRVARRVDVLRDIPATVRFISYEPALGPLDDLNLDGIDWVIYGGESGPGFRPHDLAWPRAMRDRCASLGIAFFFKQSSAWRTEIGTRLDGQTIRKFPVPRIPTSLGTVRSEWAQQADLFAL
jgi:protein gp37